MNDNEFENEWRSEEKVSASLTKIVENRTVILYIRNINGNIIVYSGGAKLGEIDESI